MSSRLKTRLLAAVIGLCGVVAGCDWPWKHDMVDQRSLQTAASPRPPAAGTIPIGGELPLDRAVAERTLSNPLAGEGATESGRELYRSYCSPCHGASGAGNGPVARFFVPPGDLTSAAVQQHSDGWIYATITNGTAHMPRQGTELSPRERWEIVNIVRTFGGARP
jgi:mono/diheme cytochrome c family protein